MQQGHLYWQPTSLFVGSDCDTISRDIFSHHSPHQEKRTPAQMSRLMKQGFVGELCAH